MFQDVCCISRFSRGLKCRCLPPMGSRIRRICAVLFFTGGEMVVDSFRGTTRLRSRGPQVPPLRFAPVGMTRGRGVLPWKGIAGSKSLFITLGGGGCEEKAGRSLGRGGRIRTRFGGVDAHAHSVEHASPFLGFRGLWITLHQCPQFSNAGVFLTHLYQRLAFS